jgi:hypothetical protein
MRRYRTTGFGKNAVEIRHDGRKDPPRTVYGGSGAVAVGTCVEICTGTSVDEDR